MKLKLLVGIILIAVVGVVSGQSTSVTNNNSITINGDVYYFKPSTTPNPPQPRVGAGFLTPASWTGEDAARAWAQIVNWTIEKTVSTSGTYLRTTNSATVYINRLAVGAPNSHNEQYITLYFWVVRSGQRMEDGSVSTRTYRVRQ